MLIELILDLFLT